MAKSKIEKLTDLSDKRIKGDKKEQDAQFQTITTDLDNMLQLAAQDGSKSYVVYESESEKDFKWDGADAKGQQGKIFLARRAKGLLERVFLHCKEAELDPEIEVCTSCKKARVVIRW
jgi:hypothetical protein